MIAIFKLETNGTFTLVATEETTHDVSMKLVDLQRADPTASFRVVENWNPPES